MSDEPGRTTEHGTRQVSRGAGGFSLGRIAGVEVRLDWSLLIIFVLITVGLTVGLLPTWHPDWSGGLILVTGASAAVLFLASVLLHELSHAVVGRRLGMRIERVTLFVFGGMAHLEDEPRTWRTEFAMAAVGPLTSLAIGAACLLLAGALAGPMEVDTEDPLATIAELGPLATLLLWLGPINILLAVFNLVPGFPLDGGRVLRAVLWGMTGDLRRATRWATGAGQAFAWLLIGSGFAMILGLRVPVFGTGLLPGLWIALIGWFLNNAAMMSYRQLVLRETLHDVPVTRVMETDLTAVAPDVSVRELVEEHLMGSSQRAFPVQDEDRFLGLVCLHDVRRVPRESRETTRVAEIMTPLEELHLLEASANADEALSLLAERRVNQIPVLEGDRLKGLVTRENIVKWISLNRPEAEGFGRPGRGLLDG